MVIIMGIMMERASLIDKSPFIDKSLYTKVRNELSKRNNDPFRRA